AMGRTWYTTAQGAVARQNGGEASPVRVRAWPKGEALCLISHTMRPDQAEALKQQYGFDLTQPMDSSIKLCIIAQGDADLYPRHGTTMEWDIAAAHAVLQAAGGSVLTEQGEPFLYGKATGGFKNGWFVARGG
ncbi:MAG: cysQ, partial [Caulobacteraceae bacterium]|nr:cysQ [Caulobacteraceae bacterium]